MGTPSLILFKVTILMTGGEHMTNWVDDAGPKTFSTLLVNSITPHVKKNKSASEERPITNSSNRSVTNRVNDARPINFPTLANSTPLLLKKAKSVSGEQPAVFHRQSISLDINNIPPVHIEVTRKYFGAKFGLSSRAPGVHLEENNSSQWQPIKPTKGSLLR